MPYISEKDRFRLRWKGEGYGPRTAGELNYLISMLVIEYVDRLDLSYQTINDVIGALEGAKVEFQRRVVAPYEDRKIALNGDLPWPSVE